MTLRRTNRLLLFLLGYMSVFGLFAWLAYSELSGPNDEEAAERRAEEIRYPDHKAMVGLPRMDLTMASVSGGSHHVRLDISLEINKDDMQRFQDFQPRVSDEIVSFLEQQDPAQIGSPQGIRTLRTHILQVSNAASGPIAVSDVVFREIVIR